MTLKGITAEQRTQRTQRTLSQCGYSPIIPIYTAEATKKSDRCPIIYLCLRPSTGHGERFLYSSDRNAHSENWTAWSGNWTAWRMLDNVGCSNGTGAERRQSPATGEIPMLPQFSPNTLPSNPVDFLRDLSGAEKNGMRKNSS